MLSGLTVPQAFADPDTSCSGSGNYYLSNGVVFRPSPAPPVQCSGEVVLDTSVVQIGASAFRGLYGITKITLPERLTTISSFAFTGARSLAAISIPASVTSIGTNVFSGTSSLQSFVVASSNMNYSVVNGALFNKNQSVLIAYPAANPQTSFTIPNGVTTISSTAFLGATNLTSITIPSSVTTIGESAFSGATSLTSITIPAAVTSIGASILDGTSSLTSITIASANQNYTVSDGALLNKSKTLLLGFPVKSLQKSFMLPDTVVRIEASMFKDAKNLVSLTLGKSLEFIGDGAFEGDSSLTAITIPSSVTSIGNHVFYSTPALTAIDVDSTNGFYCSVSGVLFDKDKVSLESYPASNPAKSFSLPSTLSEIADFALADVKNVESISLEPGNSSFVLENGALLDREKTKIIFYSRNNTNSTFKLPNTVLKVSEGAFSYAKNLTAFKVDEANAGFSTLDGVLFDKNAEMIIAYPSGSASSAYTIPSTVTGINVGAFTSSQFMTVVISDNADQTMLTNAGLGSNVRVITSSAYAEELIKAAAELKAKQEAEAKEAAEKLAAELKAAADLKAKQEAEAKEAAEKLAAELKAKQEEADAKAAADKLAAEKLAAELKAAADLKAKQEAEAKAAADKAAAELKTKQEADAKAAADKAAAEKLAAELKAKQEADAKAAAEKAAAELKTKQEADAKAAADLKTKQEAEAKAAAELKTKQEAEAKAAAELKTKQEAEAKAAAAKAAALKKKTITCIKGKLTKKVTAVKPVCPAGYKKKA